jgi:hypothetical protein
MTAEQIARNGVDLKNILPPRAITTGRALLGCRVNISTVFQPQKKMPNLAYFVAKNGEPRVPKSDYTMHLTDAAKIFTGVQEA